MENEDYPQYEDEDINEEKDNATNTFYNQNQDSESTFSQNTPFSRTVSRVRKVDRFRRNLEKRNNRNRSYSKNTKVQEVSTFNNDSILDSGLPQQNHPPEQERLESLKVESNFDNVPMSYGKMAVHIDPATERKF